MLRGCVSGWRRASKMTVSFPQVELLEVHFQTFLAVGVSSLGIWEFSLDGSQQQFFFSLGLLRCLHFFDCPQMSLSASLWGPSVPFVLLRFYLRGGRSVPNKVEASQRVAAGCSRFPCRSGDASMVAGEHLTFLTPDRYFLGQEPLTFQRRRWKKK